MYLENGIEPPVEIAGLMCAAILSDTLAFCSPTCTLADRAAAEKLAAIAGIEVHEFAGKMFEAGASLEGKSAEDVFYTDYKPFSCNQVQFGIGQSSFMSERSAAKAKELLLPYLDKVLTKKHLDVVCYMLTNIVTETTELIFAGEHAAQIVAASFPEAEINGSSAILPGVMSRKTQMVPNITKGITEWIANN